MGKFSVGNILHRYGFSIRIQFGCLNHQRAQQIRATRIKDASIRRRRIGIGIGIDIVGISILVVREVVIINC